MEKVSLLINISLCEKVLFSSCRCCSLAAASQLTSQSQQLLDVCVAKKYSQCVQSRADSSHQLECRGTADGSFKVLWTQCCGDKSSQGGGR